MEIDASTVASRVSMRGSDGDGVPLTEQVRKKLWTHPVCHTSSAHSRAFIGTQTFAQALQTAKDQIARSLLS
jgi:hypothetical protein